MSLFGVDSAVSSASPEVKAQAVPAPHPSAPIPVQGAPLGKSLRVPLGESGADVFPLILFRVSDFLGVALMLGLLAALLLFVSRSV